ncbi:SMP-30/gluconolactonase/LRE family protein [Belnapia sp. T18]|uniref:SMP-30/gluconolactonase/LRE family protein n=1 Tax=Belnapia arida TaxID=2804533 RepID=A0ABS1U8X7_9PROT|nr:SMP-30/gluconolactonase/LRE family protein [Belnapia arida]MBL6080394.1 SMP-30/gluconolactonase/LRE family protein [Belnapia arida]
MTGRGPVLGQARLVWAAGARLGEGAVWDDRGGRLWWVDIKGCSLHGMDEAGGDRRSWQLPQEPGCLALTENPARIIIGLRTGVFSFEPEAGQLEFVVAPKGLLADHHLNDGKVDPSGRFWFGTMQVDQHPAEGALHILDGPGQVTGFAGTYTVPNGPAFSPDGHVMYCADSPIRIVYSYDLRREISEKRMFVRFGDDDGCPDGLAVDAEGCLWVAHWGGGCISRFSADGQLRGRIELPTENVTSCAFGGVDMRTLFITTAGGPDGAGTGIAGGVFAARTEVAGLPSGRARLME